MVHLLLSSNKDYLPKEVLFWMKQNSNHEFNDKNVLSDLSKHYAFSLDFVPLEKLKLSGVEWETRYRIFKPLKLSKQPIVVLGNYLVLDGRYRAYRAIQKGFTNIKALVPTEGFSI